MSNKEITENIEKIFSKLCGQTEKEMEYKAGVRMGLTMMKNSIITELEKYECSVKSNQENPILADKLATSAIDGIGKIKLCDKKLYATEEELKEILKNDPND